MTGELFRRLQYRHLLAVIAYCDLFADRNLVRRNVYLASIDRNVSVTNQLTSLAPGDRKPKPIHHVIQAPLELFQQFRAGYTFCARGFLEVVAELLFQGEIDALGLL